MKDLVSAFLERFKHPILYSVLTSLAIWNFDFIYRLAIAPFHIQAMNPNEILKEFADELNVNRWDRVYSPIIKGYCVGAFLPSLIDIVYSTIVSYAMSIKEMGVDWGKRKSWSFKIQDSRETAVTIGEAFENIENWVNAGLLKSDAKIYLFRTIHHFQIGRVVKFISFEKAIKYTSDQESYMGIVFKNLPNNFVLVLVSGSVTDPDILLPFEKFQDQFDFLKISNNGFLQPIEKFEQEKYQNAYAILNKNQKTGLLESIKIIKPSRDIAPYSRIKFRLFGDASS
ncbi:MULTISPECIES: hypothetical protein [Leptospira]|uniref:hypothetical protein n=1 Tax=Leptospira TaxID=171 RepID=UPI0002BDEDE6|nr:MULTISPECIES: hypothetical protein [Leptospira]EMJ64556.1 hypothetical protein LEP1GSC051_2126 [Leptospira sp. P2653]ULH29222.1 hypothetical protein FH586_04710 [Leptospira weilii]